MITLPLVEPTTSPTKSPLSFLLIPLKLKSSVLPKVQSSLSSRSLPSPLALQSLLTHSLLKSKAPMPLVTSTSLVPKSLPMTLLLSPLDVMMATISMPTVFAKLALMVAIPVPLVMTSAELTLALSSVVSSVVSL